MPTPAPSPAGELLREWRDLRGMSQLALAHAAEVSSRHLSFVETGRSRPSRAMVLRLAEALEMPLRVRNALLVAAGHAAVYRQRALDEPGLAPVARALDRILAAHAPYPAFVVDRSWTILRGNAPHERSLAALRAAGIPIPQHANAVQLVLSADLLRPFLVNWKEVAQILLRRVRRELRRPDRDPALAALLDELLSDPALAGAASEARPPDPATEVLVPMTFELDGVRSSWFSTLATVGTPLDVTLEEILIESLFPADDATAERVAADGTIL